MTGTELESHIFLLENDVLNGLGMLFEKLLTNTSMFSDVRTYWSPEAVKEDNRI